MVAFWEFVFSEHIVLACITVKKEETHRIGEQNIKLKYIREQKVMYTRCRYERIATDKDKLKRKYVDRNVYR